MEHFLQRNVPLRYSLKLITIFCSKNFSIEVDMKSTIYCQAVENGDETEWDFGWQQYENSNVATEKRDLLGALSCTKEVWLLNRYILKSENYFIFYAKACSVYLLFDFFFFSCFKITDF